MVLEVVARAARSAPPTAATSAAAAIATVAPRDGPVTTDGSSGVELIPRRS
jgi:hypothetical protein